MIRASWVVPALLAAGAAAWAQDFQVGSRAKGMGGSYTAFDEDPVAIWLNPAGIAGAPTRFGVDYQTFTQYELTDAGVFLGVQGEPQTGLLDPPIVPSFIGFTTSITEGEAWRHQAGVALIRPFQNRLTYLSGATRVQTEQQFSRFRFAYAAQVRDVQDAEETRFSFGVGADLGFTHYKENDDVGLLDRTDSETQIGYGAGILVSWLNLEDGYTIDFGIAYQSMLDFDFQIDDTFFPVWDWPAMLNTGVTIKMLGTDLRITADVQFIYWDRATGDDATGANIDFENSVNVSVGVEYLLWLTADHTIALMPRLGYRKYDAPWGDDDLLPAIGTNVLSIETDDDKFDIVTFGCGVQWTTEDGKVRSVDLGVEIGGDAPNVSVGYRHDF